MYNDAKKNYLKFFAQREQLHNKYDKRMLITRIIFQIVKPNEKFHKFSPQKNDGK